jgi:hypothetical protein
VINKYGSDALRLYLVNSPVVRAESLRFKEEGVFAVVKDIFLPWYNAYRFAPITCTTAQHQAAAQKIPSSTQPLLTRIIITLAVTARTLVTALAALQLLLMVATRVAVLSWKWSCCDQYFVTCDAMLRFLVVSCCDQYFVTCDAVLRFLVVSCCRAVISILSHVMLCSGSWKCCAVINDLSYVVLCSGSW